MKRVSSYLPILLALLTVAVPQGQTAPGNVPARREELSLNGDWEQGGRMPQYQGEKFDRKTYQHQVEVPKHWEGKRLFLEFRQVNYAAKVYVNHQLVGEHVGAWIPFSIDLTKRVKAGSTFILRVEVTSSTLPPSVDENGDPLWPIGTYHLDGSYAGIVDDVWLRAYGPVAIHDAFIQTSFREKTLAVDYTLVNHTDTPRTVSVRASAASGPGEPAARTLQTGPIALPPGETKVVTARTDWPDPGLWTPDQPRLYQLRSQVIEMDRVVDEETRRFGFREIWIADNQFLLNGHRINLIGDSIPRSWTDKARLTPENWPATVDLLMHDLNMRVIRWHQFPAADHLLETSDEKGLLIIDESALYDRPRAPTKRPNRRWLTT